MLNFKPAFSLSSFKFINGLFSSCSLSSLRVVSSAYLRLLIFLLAILVLACASSSPAFRMMYSAYKLNKQVETLLCQQKVRLGKVMVFPVVMYGCESWTVKKAECQRIDAFELWCWRRLFESPLDCKEIQPVHSKGDQSWVFFGRNDAKAETPVLWPLHAKS